jgi:hypothetical protein
MARGFQYLMAIIDVDSRKTLSWTGSNTMTPTSASRPYKRPWESMVRIPAKVNNDSRPS